MRLLWSGTAWDRLRLWTGLVLFAFVATHLLNHAVGLWSLEAMTMVQHWRLAVTRSPPGFIVTRALSPPRKNATVCPHLRSMRKPISEAFLARRRRPGANA